MKDKIPKNKYFCILPFIHLSIFNDHIKPCCRFGVNEDFVKNINKNIDQFNNFTEILCHKEYDHLRSSIISGEKIDGCYKCYMEDESGCESLRAGSNNLYRHYLSKDLKPKLKFLEIGFSNLCNNRCRTCSSDLSTAWREDDIKLEKFLKFRYAKYYDIKTSVKALTNRDYSELDGLEYLKIVGGEPMLDANFKKFLRRLIDSRINRHCHLDIFTNVSYFPDDNTIELVNSFRTGRVHLSIDSYGKINEYIRFPSRWRSVEKSAIKWLALESDNVALDVQLEVTISIYSVLYLENLIDWWLRIRAETGNKRNAVHFIFLFNPDLLSIINVSDIIKESFIEKIVLLRDKYKDDKNIIFNIENLHSFISGVGKDKVKDFLAYTYFLDKIRNESFEDVFPELSKLLIR